MVQGERRGTSTGGVAEPQSHRFRGRLKGAPPDQKEPRVPQPGLFRFPGRFYVVAGVAGAIHARREARTRSRSPPSRPPRRWSIVASRPPAMKSHASATGSRSRMDRRPPPGRAGSRRRRSRAPRGSAAGPPWRSPGRRGLVQRLDPEVDEPDPRALRHVAVRDPRRGSAPGPPRPPARRTRAARARPRRGRRGRGRASSRSGGRGSAR